MINKKIKEKIPNIQFDISLKNYSTFRIGGKAKYFFKAQTKKDLISVLKLAKEYNIPFRVIGGGSKLLIPDNGFDGLVVKTENSNFQVKDETVFLESGVPSNHVVQIALEEELTGAEWLTGIPGTIGGAIRGNAGDFNGSMQDIILKVNFFDLEKETEDFFNNEECQFGYRTSIFKESSNLIILSCEIELKKGDKKKIKNLIEKYFNHRRENHPLLYPSVGCIFTNPKVESKEIPVWKLIVDSGLVGKRIGNVKVSKKHSNFIINLGEGKAEEVEQLINLIKETILKKSGIELEEEIQYL